jgi:phosphate transport system substrate-binding protein
LRSQYFSIQAIKYWRRFYIEYNSRLFLRDYRLNSQFSFENRAISTIAVVAIVIVIVVVAVVGAYYAVSYSRHSTSNTTTATTSSALTASLTGAGSTLVQPAMSAWAYNFTSQASPGVVINYQAIGSGGGVAALQAGTVNFGASDAPLTAAQYGSSSSGLAKYHVLQIPEIVGGVVPAYNLGSSFTTALKFNGTVLADIFLGTIYMWNDPAIQQLNPGVTLPAAHIIAVHRSDGSGTTFVFTDYLSHSSSVWNSTVGSSTTVSWCGSGNPSTNCGSNIQAIGTKGSTGVTGYIAGNSYTIGYVETVYAAQAKLLFGSIQNAAGEFVLANSTTEQAGLSAASSATFPSGNQSWATVSLVDLLLKNTTATTAYPLVTLTYIMVYQEQTITAAGTSSVTKNQAIALATFLWWLINNQNNSQTDAQKLGYVALPAKLVAIDDASILSMKYNGQRLISGTP